MHRFKIILAAIVLAALSTPARLVVADNPVVNPSFELGVDANGVPDAWQISDHAQKPSEKALVEVIPDRSFDGQHCLHLKGTSGFLLATQKVSVKPNTGYRLRAAIRTGSDLAPQSLVAYDAVGTPIASKSAGLGYIYASCPDWLVLDFGFRTGAKDSVINVGLLSYAKEVFWDAVSLVEDDRVKIGDVSPAVNPLPALNPEERDRGFLVFTRPLEISTTARYVPTREECAAEVSTFSPRGEYETLLVMIHALKDLPPVGAQWVQVPKKQDQKLADVELFRLGYTQCEVNSQAYIRYPLLLLPPTPMVVPEGDVAQWAIRVKIPADAPPGQYVGTLAITVAGQPQAQVKVTVEVLPLTLDPADVVFFMYYNDVYYPPEVAMPAMQRKYYEDMAAHGMNSVTLYVVPEKEENGRYAIDLDHDWRYKPDDPRHPLGMRQRIDQMKAAGLVLPERPLVLISGAAKMYDWGCFRGNADSVKSLIKHGRDLGWPPLLFYVQDEPNDEARAKAVRAVFETTYTQAPEARKITAIDTWGIEHVGSLYNAWIVALKTADVAGLVEKKSGEKDILAYDCEYRGHRPKIDRYLCGLWTFSTGIKGLGQWGYTAAEKLKKDKDGAYITPTGWATSLNDYYVGITDEGPMSTVGWEGRREGIEDYRYLITLKRLLAGASGPAADKGQALLAEARRMAPVNSFSKSPQDYRYTWEFDPAAGVTPPTMAALRMEIAQAIRKLSKSRPE